MDIKFTSSGLRVYSYVSSILRLVYNLHGFHIMLAEMWEHDGVLQLRSAFSRDQPHKVYVQHLVAEDSQLLWELLQVRLNEDTDF